MYCEEERLKRPYRITQVSWTVRRKRRGTCTPYFLVNKRYLLAFKLIFRWFLGVVLDVSY